MAVTMFNGRPIPNKCPICDDPIKYREAKAEWRDAVAHFSCVARKNTEGVLNPSYPELANMTASEILARHTEEILQLPDLIVKSAADSPMTRAYNRAHIRQFESGANRDSDVDKLDFEGFLSPIVLQAYAEYMHTARHLPDGTFRESDNWQKGMPFAVFMKSVWRHFMDMWLIHRGYNARSDMKEALCGLLFNVMGYLHQTLEKELEDEKTESD